MVSWISLLECLDMEEVDQINKIQMSR
jgi:hypothetical protein